MKDFERLVLETIDKHNMIQPGQTVIAAVSGGYDSLCMLHVLCNLRRLRKFEVCTAHVNHSFRHEADGDQAFVEAEAERLGIKSYSIKVDVAKYANENKISFETAGRNIRYSFFNKIAENYDNPVIATAHNANDSAESMLMHLMRGSGLTGLAGIRPVSGKIIRPLIDADRCSIEKYCDKNEIIPRHDRTNDCDDYTRNDVRHNILSPLLERCSISSLLRTMDVVSAEDQFLEHTASQIAEKYINHRGNEKVISVKDFNQLHVALKRRILKIALGNTDEDKQICLVHIDEIIKLAEKNYGGKKILIPGGKTVTLTKGELVL